MSVKKGWSNFVSFRWLEIPLHRNVTLGTLPQPLILNNYVSASFQENLPFSRNIQDVFMHQNRLFLLIGSRPNVYTNFAFRPELLAGWHPEGSKIAPCPGVFQDGGGRNDLDACFQDFLIKKIFKPSTRHCSTFIPPSVVQGRICQCMPPPWSIITPPPPPCTRNDQSSLCQSIS